MLPVFVLAERRLKNGGASGEEVADLEKKTLNTEKLNDPMEYIATVQGNPASKYLVGLPKVKPSQMSITAERVAAKCAR